MTDRELLVTVVEATEEAAQSTAATLVAASAALKNAEKLVEAATLSADSAATRAGWARSKLAEFDGAH